MTSGTEGLSRRFAGLDEWPTLDVLKALHEGQLAAVAAVTSALPALAGAVEAAAALLGRGKGRLIYAGAGTSARISVQDAAELPPTFGWPQARIDFAVAGGHEVLWCAIEGAEDSVEDARSRVRHLEVGELDVMIGVAASGTTPYTVAALAEGQASRRAHRRHRQQRGRAASRGERASDPRRDRRGGDWRLDPDEGRHGAEDRAQPVLDCRDGAPWPRLQGNDGRFSRHQREAATAQRGRWWRRSRIATPRSAKQALIEAEGEVKLAALVALGISRDEAKARLAHHGGNLRLALRERRKEKPEIVSRFTSPAGRGRNAAKRRSG